VFTARKKTTNFHYITLDAVYHSCKITPIFCHSLKPKRDLWHFEQHWTQGVSAFSISQTLKVRTLLNSLQPLLTCAGIVAVPPNILDANSTQSSVAVRENQNITLTCKADGFPAPKLMWRREDGQGINIERRKKGKPETQRDASRR
jgi:hypothetical protein